MTLNKEARGIALLNETLRTALIYSGMVDAKMEHEAEAMRLEAIEAYRLMVSFIRDSSTVRTG